MAVATLVKLGTIFPPGTSVGAYALDPNGHPSGAPGISATDTATVTTAGGLSFAGLAPNRVYWAYALIGSDHRYVKFVSEPGEDDGQEDAGISRGVELYVDAVAGDDSNNGLSWADAVATVEQAVSLASGGDTIYLIGKTREEGVVIPNSLGGLKIVGAGGRASHADSPWPYASAAWLPPASPTADTDLLVIRGQGVTIENILFDCPVDAAGIRLERNALSGTSEFDASHLTVRNCRFDSGSVGIEDVGGSGFVLVDDCRFMRLTDATGAAILNSSTAVANPLNWEIRDSKFLGNDRHIDAPASGWVVYDNIIDGAGTTSIDFTGGVAGNIVTKNYLGGAYDATLYKVAGAGDEWGGNFNVLSGGVTAADPA
ncbi:MAG: right-handed parallel beta-helix repeat-containing protein [Dehalococcoidia bacterium]|nr:MAG: right-handed parallel beta-helix repeat-containing protein [Dehalococcoidia bacterium]